MILKGLSIQGFRSFVGDHVFHFPRTPGVYFVGGDNQAEPEISPNGCGKSSLWEALVWVLYGQTTRKQKAGAVASWADEYVTVCALDVEIRGVQYSITRSWNPNALTLQVETDDPHKIVQDDIDSLIGMNYERFCATVVLSQFGTRFLNLSPAAKLASFARVLGLDYWLDVADRAAKDEERLAAILRRQSESESQLLAGLEHDRRTWESVKASADAWQDEQLRNIAMAETHVRRAKEQADAMATQFERLELEQAEHNEWLREAEVESNKRRSTIHKIDESIQQLDDEARGIDDKLARQQETKSKIKAMIGRCPTCRQRVSDKHAKNVVESVDGKVRELAPKLTELDQEIARLRDRKRHLSHKHDEKESGLQAQRNKAHQQASDIARLHDQRVYADRAVQQAELSLQNEKDCLNPNAGVLHDLVQRMKAVDERLEEVQLNISDAKIQHRKAAYWKAEYKALRLWVCQQAMSEYSAIMGAAIEQLGLNGWQVRAELERPTKKGTMQRGFQLFIKSPKSPDWVPFESWSGGETQRLLLAGDVSFAELETSRSGLSPSAEVWDEPTNHLSQGGIQSLMEYLHTRARRTGKQIYMVDHHVVESGQFAGTYTVVKDQDGSRIVNNSPQRLDYAQPAEDDGRLKQNRPKTRRRVPA